MAMVVKLRIQNLFTNKHCFLSVIKAYLFKNVKIQNKRAF